MNGTHTAQKLTDLSPMPWGKHVGKLMQDVPAQYLHWLWINGKDQEDADSGCPVGEYIRRNIKVLQMEYKDGIW